MVTITVKLTPRLKPLDAADGEDLDGMEILTSVPGGQGASVRLPDDWTAEQIDAWVAQQQAKGRVEPDEEYANGELWQYAKSPVWTPLWLGPPTAHTMRLIGDLWVAGDSFASLGVTAATQRRGHHGQGIRIGILDTYMDASHPWLRAHVVWQGGAGRDGAQHATHVAGTAAGAYGVAPQAAILSYNCLPNDRGSPQEIHNGYRALADQGCDVINCSFGAPGMRDRLIGDGVRYCQARNILVIAAAGNTRGAGIGSPAYEADMIVVALERDSENPCDFASGTNWTDPNVIPRLYGAIGRDIVSSLPGGGEGPASGSSMSTPQKSGLAALLRAA